MNSKKKGSRGERALRDVWKSHGYKEAHRSQQYSGRGESSADIEGIDPRLHIECKVGYTYKTIYDFLEQAVRDSKEGQIPIVNCKMDRKEWLCVMRLDDFIEMWKNREDIVRCIDCKHHYIQKVNEHLGVRKCSYTDDTIMCDGYCPLGERSEDG